MKLKWTTILSLLIFLLLGLYLGLFTVFSSQDSDLFLPYHFQTFKVISVNTGNELLVTWLTDDPSGTDLVGRRDSLKLAGIFSSEKEEPKEVYQERIRFLRDRLKGLNVRASVEFIYSPKVLESPYADRFIYEKLSAAAEVQFEDRSSLNELLLKEGHAIFDINERNIPWKDRKRYKSAEKDGIEKHRGLWSSEETSRIYLRIKEKHKEQIAWKRSGFISYVSLQLVLMAAVLLLIHLTKHDPRCHHAATCFLWLPAILLVAEIWRLIGLPSNPGIHANYFFGGLIIACWLFRQMVILIAYGPLEEWKDLWAGYRIWIVLVLFFAAFWGSILIFGVVYGHMGAAGSLGAGIQLSIAEAFNLSSSIPVEKSPTLSILLPMRNLLVLLLVIISGALIPSAIRKHMVGSRFSAAATSICSLIVLSFGMASVFSILYYYSIYQSSLSDIPHQGHCFVYALAALFRVPYESVYTDSGFIRLLQIIEGHIGFLISIVGIQAIFAVWKQGPNEREGKGPLLDI